MRKIHFALVAATSLALAACGSQQDDTLSDNIGENLEDEDLNALAEDAAEDANAEMQAAEPGQQQVEAPPAAEEPAATAEPGEEVTTEPSEVEDEPLGL